MCGKNWQLYFHLGSIMFYMIWCMLPCVESGPHPLNCSHGYASKIMNPQDCMLSQSQIFKIKSDLWADIDTAWSPSQHLAIQRKVEQKSNFANHVNRTSIGLYLSNMCFGFPVGFAWRSCPGVHLPDVMWRSRPQKDTSWCNFHILPRRKSNPSSGWLTPMVMGPWTMWHLGWWDSLNVHSSSSHVQQLKVRSMSFCPMFRVYLGDQ